MWGVSAGAEGCLPRPAELGPELGPGESGRVGPRAGISYATAGPGGIGEDRDRPASQRFGKGRLARTDPTNDAGLQRLMRQEGRGSRVITWLLLAVPMCMVLGVVVAAGDPPPGVSGTTYALALVISTLSWYGSVLVLPLVLVVSAVCAGVIVKQVLARRGAALAWGVAPALGLGALLTAIHGVWWLAGFVGGLHGYVATIVAWVIVLAPVIAWQRTGRLPTWIFAGGMLAAGLEGTSPKEVEAGRERWRAGLVVLLVIGMGLGFVLPYAMVPPGVLWPSEYGGYDALSYHLPLAQEWYTRGWLAPVTHNVYSFLPSYVEGAFVHMAAMAGSPQDVRAGADAVEHVAVGLLAGDGRLVLSAQSLHALMLGFAAWSVAGLVRVIAERAGLTRDERARGAVNVACVIAAMLVVTAPWMVVTGTLAYNEAALVAMLAAAMACALSGGLSARARGVLCGVLTGLACCTKPSALVLGAPMVGIAMLVGCWDAVRGASDATLGATWRAVGARRVGMCVGVCLVAGAVTLSPWLVRNAIVAGNPVFPFAAGVLGHGHWSEEQAARYAAAHKPDRGVVAAMGLLVLPDARVGADARSVQRYRGVTNPQWMPLMPMGAVGLIALIVMATTRRTGLVLGGGVMAIALAWAAMTHAQSRFLVVLVPIAAASAAAAIAVVLAGVAGRGHEARARVLSHVAIGGVVAITAVVWMTTGPAAQAARQSALATTTYGGPTMMTAVGVARELDSISRAQAGQGGNDGAMSARIDEVFASASPTSYAALLPNVDLTRVLLVGNATPLYAGPMAYFTAWDTWPLLTQMEKEGEARDEPREWTRGLREEGYSYAIVDLAEVTRLSQSGYLDPKLTPERVGEWMRTTRLVRGWGDRGVFLVDLRREPGEPGVRGIDGLERVPSGGGGE